MGKNYQALFSYLYFKLYPELSSITHCNSSVTLTHSFNQPYDILFLNYKSIRQVSQNWRFSSSSFSDFNNYEAGSPCTEGGRHYFSREKPPILSVALPPTLYFDEAISPNDKRGCLGFKERFFYAPPSKKADTTIRDGYIYGCVSTMRINLLIAVEREPDLK